MAQSDENAFRYPESQKAVFKMPMKDYAQRTEPKYAPQSFEVDEIVYKVGLLVKNNVSVFAFWRSKIKFELEIEVVYEIKNENSGQRVVEGGLEVKFEIDQREILCEIREIPKSQLRELLASFGLLLPLTCSITTRRRGDPQGEEPEISGDELPTETGGSASSATYPSSWGGNNPPDMYGFPSVAAGSVAGFNGGYSKQKFAGLENQGATCYMNSLLQTLYHITQLRKSVYRIPTRDGVEPSEDGEVPIAFALQNLFYQMQTEDEGTVVSTDDLIRSFGWTTADAFQQHDVQEFCRVLMDSLEDMMKGSEVEGTIGTLFKGTCETYVDCINVDYKSTKMDSFEDIQLQVKGCSDIYESFHHYIDQERLEGPNKYFAGHHGKQEANKGVRFLELPSVLLCQLKRFEWDPLFNSQRKVNDEFQFYERINLNKFVYRRPKKVVVDENVDSDAKMLEDGEELDGDGDFDMDADTDVKMADDSSSTTSENDALFVNVGDVGDESGRPDELPPLPPTQFGDEDEPDIPGFDGTEDVQENNLYDHQLSTGEYIYRLHSVLVHSGSTYGGHYKAFIRPDGKADWFSFNDEYTRDVDAKAAVTDNYGGAYQRASAYMLVYVKESKFHDLCGEIASEDIPEELKQQLDAISARREEEDRLKKEDARKVDVTFTLMSDVMKSQMFGDVGESTMRKRRMNRAKSESDIFEFIENEFGIQRADQFLFHLTQRKNLTKRPNKPFLLNRQFSFELKRRNFFVAERNTFIHITPNFDDANVSNIDECVWNTDGGNFILLVVKYFDVECQQLRVLGGAVVHEHDTFLQDIARKIWPLISKDPNDGELEFAEEESFNNEKFTPLQETHKSVTDFAMINGDVLVVQFVSHAASANGERSPCEETLRYATYISRTFECTFVCTNKRQWRYVQETCLHVETVPSSQEVTARIETGAKVDDIRRFLGMNFGIDEAYWSQMRIQLKHAASYGQPRINSMSSWSTLYSNDLLSVLWDIRPVPNLHSSVKKVTFVPLPSLAGAFDRFSFEADFGIAVDPSKCVNSTLEYLRHPIYCIQDSDFNFKLISEQDTDWWVQSKWGGKEWHRVSGYLPQGEIFAFVDKPVEPDDEMKMCSEHEDDGDVVMTDSSSHSSGSNTDSGSARVDMQGEMREEENDVPQWGLFRSPSDCFPVPFVLHPDKCLRDYLNECDVLRDRIGPDALQTATFQIAIHSKPESATSTEELFEIGLERNLTAAFQECQEKANRRQTGVPFLFVVVSLVATSFVSGSKRNASSVNYSYDRPLKIRKTNHGKKKAMS